MASRTVILRVEESKVDDLLGALSKRPYIEVVNMDRESRKRLRDCPCCKTRLSKEVLFLINEKMLFAMLDLIRVMAISRSVILVNKDNPIEDIPSVERDRCSAFDRKLLEKAETLGLVRSFVDGSRKSYFTDALNFFLNEEPHTPSQVVTLNGKVIETSGSMFFDEVKLKDEKTRDKLKREFKDAIKAIPASTRLFVESGQMTLV